MPKNAGVRADGFRFYPWPGGDTPLNRKYNAVEASDLLSVTSIRSLVGTPYQIVNWQIANVVNAAMGVRKAVRIGPRGGVKEVYVKDGAFPGEFVTRMIESRGEQAKLDEHRRWLRQSADEPRDVAAVRGSVVHKLIELRAPMDLVDEDLVRKRFDLQWQQERRKVKPDVTDEDVHFAVNGMRQYWDMRTNVPFVILAQEPQVYNLEIGYGGSADVLMWFLGQFEEDGSFTPLPDVDPDEWQKRADKRSVTLAQVLEVGGFLAVGDWKTSKSVQTSHVVQTVAYMAATFIAEDGLIDERLSDLLAASLQGLVIHIRPNLWAVDFFDMRPDVLRAFIGSVAHARFLATHGKPHTLFTRTLQGVAPGTDASDEGDDDE